VSIQFQIEATEGPARVGRLTLPHGVIETPVFMLVGTLASVKGVPQDVLEELGVQILLSNTYHLYLRPGVETIRRMGGLHRFMSWDRAILTDSGGFQVFSLNELRKVSEDGVTFRSHLDGSSHFFSPESAMAAQIGLGADIIMAFDECTEYPAERERARASMEMTLRWAERSQKYFEQHKSEVPWADQTQSLFGIVQGGMDLELRRESALRTVEIGFPGYAIGGLSVGEPRELTREVVESTLEHLPADKPRYLMGVGKPDDLVQSVARGVDVFDCVLPTRNARNGQAFTADGPVTLKQARYVRDGAPLDAECGCYACRGFSRAYLRHLFMAGELLAFRLLTLHNVTFFLRLMQEMRAAIVAGAFGPFRARFFSRYPVLASPEEHESD